MLISELINQLQGELEVNGDMTILRKDQYDSYDDPRYRYEAQVDIEAINADRDAEEEEESARNDVKEAKEALEIANDELDEAKEIAVSFDSTCSDEYRAESVQDVIQAGIYVEEAKAQLTAAQKELDRVYNLDDKPNFYVISC